MDKEILIKNIRDLLNSNNDYFGQEKYETLIEFCRILCRDYHIKVIPEPYTIQNELRIAFSTNRDVKCTTTLQYECNGLIIGIDTKKLECRFVCVPSHNADQTFDNDLLARNIIENRYNIFNIKDGSTVNLYYFAGDWFVSTRNSISMTDNVWRNKDFTLCVLQLMKKNKIVFGELRTHIVYTLGFKNREMHMYDDIPDSIWFIQAYDLERHRVILYVPPELSTISAQTPTQLIPSGDNPLLLDVLKQHELRFLGYVLQPRDPDNPNTPAIIIPSDLWLNIKYMAYQINSFVRIGANSPKFFTDSNYVFLRNFIRETGSDSEISISFVALFPRFENLYDHFRGLFSKIMKTTYMLIAEDINNAKQRHRRLQMGPVNTSLMTQDLTIYSMADCIRSSRGLYENIRAYSGDRDMIKNIIHRATFNMQNVDLYYQILIRGIDIFSGADT